MIIEYDPALLTRLLRGLLLGLLLAALTALGAAVSPLDAGGRPLLLSPHLAQVAAYQREARTWSAELAGVLQATRTLLDSQESAADLFTRDRTTGQLQARLEILADQLEQASPPDTLAGLHTLQQEALLASLQASAAISTWLAAPWEAQADLARQALREADNALARLQDSPWIRP